MRPDLVVLDVNETLSDLSPLEDAFLSVGLGAAEVEPWFAGVLRDGFALTAMGANPAFGEVAASALRVRLAAAGADDPVDGADRVMAGFTELSPHPDVVPGLLALAATGCRIVTLSNGSAEVARALLGPTEVAPLVEAYLSVADAPAWKPDPRAYRHALDLTGVTADRAALVAVHPWDVAGARAAGLRTAWINRTGARYPDHLAPAETEVRSFVALAEAWSG